MRKPPHLDGKLDRGPVAADARRVRRARDWRHLQVQLRSEAAVEPHLFVAIELALGQRGEVQKLHPHRLLDLVGKVAGQQHPRDVRFQKAEIAGGVRVGRGRLERLDQPCRFLHVWLLPQPGATRRPGSRHVVCECCSESKYSHISPRGRYRALDGRRAVSPTCAAIWHSGLHWHARNGPNADQPLQMDTRPT